MNVFREDFRNSRFCYGVFQSSEARLVAVSFSQLATRVFVRSTIGLWHEHPVLAQSRKLVLSLSHDLLIFGVAGFCFGRGATP